MNQAILKILDDIAKESIESFGESIPSGSYPKWIKIAKDRISSLPSDTQGYTKKEVLDFAYWYHNGLLNRYRQEVEVEFDDFIKYHRQGLIPNKIIGN